MNVFSEYSQPTVEFVWSLLKEAYEDEDKLDKLLAETADEVFAEVKEILLDMEKSGKIDMSKKIRLSEHPAIYRALKDIERNEWYKFTEWCWIGYQVITESLTRSYRNTVLWTYDTFKPKILTTTSSLKPFDVEVKITDTYITNHCLKIPWCQDGKTYSDRLWGNVANFQSKLSFVLEQGITRGKGMDWMMQAWKKLTHTAGYEVARLLKTETMAMWSQATKESYLSLGIEYEIAVENWGTIAVTASATAPGNSGTVTWDAENKILTIDATSNPNITFSVSDTGFTEIGYNIDKGEFGE